MFCACMYDDHFHTSFVQYTLIQCNDNTVSVDTEVSSST